MTGRSRLSKDRLVSQRLQDRGKRFGQAMWLVCWPFVNACSRPTMERQLPYTSRDSAGIAIVEMDSAVAALPLSWLVASSPDVEIGGADSIPEFAFFRIQGAAQLPTGEILVLDGASKELRFFDEDGKFLRMAGGLGGGPGELRDPVLVPSTNYDSLLVFDRRRLKLIIFASDGHFLQAHDVRIRHGEPAGWLGGGRIVMTQATLINPLGPERVIPRSMAVSIAGMDTELVDTIVVVPTRPLEIARYHGETNIDNVPGTVDAQAVGGPNGIYVSSCMSPELKRYDTEGRIDRIVRIRRIDQSDRERSENRVAFCDKLLVDTDRHLWLEAGIVRPGTPRIWMVMTWDGAPLGSVSLPADVQVMQIKRKKIIAKWQDELGVEYIRRYALLR